MRYFSVDIFVLGLCCLIVTSARLNAAERDAEAVTNPKKAGIEYKLQGE